MTKLKIVLPMVLAALAFGAVAAESALATGHKWLNLSGESLKRAEEALTDGSLEIHHKPPAVLGGGEITVHCDGELHGTVGPESADLISALLELTGGDGAKIHCEVTDSTNTLCPGHELVEVRADNMSWESELLLSGSTIYDHIFEDGRNGKPGYEMKCKSTITLCTGLELAQWDENEATGALFLFTQANTLLCSDGGSGTILGHYVVLDFFVS